MLAQQQVEAAVFDTSRLVDFTESVQYTGPAVQLTPLVREAGCLAVTDARLYFQPLHNVTGDSPVRVFALSDVAAMARRRSSLKPTGALHFSCHVHVLCRGQLESSDFTSPAQQGLPCSSQSSPKVTWVGAAVLYACYRGCTVSLGRRVVSQQTS